jgi:hypothetical protein
MYTLRSRIPKTAGTNFDFQSLKTFLNQNNPLIHPPLIEWGNVYLLWEG